ncbi:hypothetical protein IHE45_17G054000 [Dioscorea alata]|uniref:Uncharacterized protein n=1 Tax=Dioscorea alata TaxID=55571 RepID=A0ACB7UCE1_DIOAL|nr:hypothetical protein IHE45_17G054000 [Dioscorea alata]
MVLFLSFGTTSTTIMVSSRCPCQTNPEEEGRLVGELEPELELEDALEQSSKEAVKSGRGKGIPFLCLRWLCWQNYLIFAFIRMRVQRSFKSTYWSGVIS